MIEKLVAPNAQWRLVHEGGEAKFVHDAGIDPESGVKTLWEKIIEEDNFALARHETHPASGFQRSTTNFHRSTGDDSTIDIYGPGIRTLILRDTPLNLDVTLNLSKLDQPAHLNVGEMTASYTEDGHLKSIGLGILAQENQKYPPYFASFDLESADRYRFNATSAIWGRAEPQEAGLRDVCAIEFMRYALVRDQEDLVSLIWSELNPTAQIVVATAGLISMDIILPTIASNNPQDWAEVFKTIGTRAFIKPRG